MSVSYGMALNNIASLARSAIADALVDRIDLGSGTATGKIKIYTSAFGTLLATLDFSNPAFGAASVGVATASAITNATAAATGTAALLRVVDRDDGTIFEGTVSTSGADLNLNTTSITINDTVSITAATITMPAS